MQEIPHNLPPAPATPSFAEPTPPRSFPTTAVAIAATAILLLVVFFVTFSRRGPASSGGDGGAYAANLVISNIQLSEANNTLGGKSTYVEGHMANHGASTVTAVTAQVVFANDLGFPPQVETTPVFLIRSREPYIDTEPISAAPLPPGGEADFRMTFENVNDNWNTQPPGIKLIQITTR